MRKFSSDEALAEAILQGGETRLAALRQLFTDPELEAATWLALEPAGCHRRNCRPLLEDGIAALDSAIRNHLFPQDGWTARDFAAQAAKQAWLARLPLEEALRQEVLACLGADKALHGQVVAEVCKRGGSREDGDDFYQQGFLVVEKNLCKSPGSDGAYKGGSIKGYFKKVCIFLWQNESRKIHPGGSPEELEKPDRTTPESLLFSKEEREQLQKALDRIGEPCRTILQMWNDGYSMLETAEELDIRNERDELDPGKTAVKKHRCLKRMLDFFKIS